MVKRGLIICYYFPPAGGGGVQRWVKFIKYLSRLNWAFTIITAPVEPGMPKDEVLQTEIPPSTKIIRTPDSNPYGGFLSFLKKRLSRGYLLRWLSALIYITDSRKNWNKSVWPVLIKEIESDHYDCIIVSSPPYSLSSLAVKIQKHKNIPVFLDLRDPWTTNPYKIYPSAIHRFLDQRREKKQIGQVNNLISVYHLTFDHLERVIKTFNQKNRVVIPNGYDDEDFDHLPQTENIRQNGYHLAFSGTFYSHLNRPDNLFAAIGILKKEGIIVRFHHFGQSMLDLKRMAEKYGINDQLNIWGYIEHGEVLAKLCQMDALCLILDPESKNAEKTVGGKFYEYLRFRKPIFSCSSSRWRSCPDYSRYRFRCGDSFGESRNHRKWNKAPDSL